jgi:type II secretory pathway component GspD/PulD (secretin)
VLLVLIGARSIGAEQIEHLEFSNAPITDILVSLGRATGNSVVPDETVTGNATYYFRDVSFREALAAFTRRFDLFVDHADGIYAVSAVRVGAAGDTLSVQASDVALSLLLHRLSRAARVPILFERLPDRAVTFYCEDSSLAAILRQLAAQLPDHHVEEHEGAFLFAYSPQDAPRPAERWITRTGERYSIRSERARLDSLLALLFRVGEREYQLLKRGVAHVEPLSFTGKRFDELLTLILERADAAHVCRDGIYYISDRAHESAVAETLATDRLTLEHVSATTLVELLPPDQRAGVAIRPDRRTNTLTLTGHRRDVDRLRHVIAKLDVLPEGRAYRRHSLETLSPAALPALLPSHLQAVQLVALPERRAVISLATAEQARDLEAFIALVDSEPETALVELEHIRIEHLLAHLPPSATREDIVTTGHPRRLFFLGGRAQRERFLRQLREIDRPRRQIRYHLLVIQHQSGHDLDFDIDLSNSLTTPDSRQAFLGSIGNLLSLNFDVVSTFGYQFAARLNASLGEATATVVADTTLSALAGEAVSFRNTNTYRYRDIVVDPDTGRQLPTGVVREIASGLVVEITGQTEEDAVTMDIAATISRRGSDATGTGNPPPTSEKVVHTHVRAELGAPVILSGLYQREDEISSQKTPLLAHVPLLGGLFQNRRATSDSTELAIYIVPRMDRDPSDRVDLEHELLDIYHHNFGAEE